MNLDPHNWQSLEPEYLALEAETVTPQNVDAWLGRWNEIEKLMQEARGQAARKFYENTGDALAEQNWLNLIENIFPKCEVMEDKLNKKLLAVGHEPGPDQVQMMRKVRNGVELFKEENVPIWTELSKLGNEYDKTIGLQSIVKNSQEVTMAQASIGLLNPNRDVRQETWHALQARMMQDREALNALLLKMVGLRGQIAKNAGCKNFLEYTWKMYGRFDYTPNDCVTLHEAIEQGVVPLANRLLEQDRQNFGYASMRPWDFDWRFPLDPKGNAALKPFDDVSELEEKGVEIFKRVDTELGAQFELMRQNGLLDLGSRKGKAPGGFCDAFPITGMPYIFQNAVGVQDDVQTLLHEGGHAFHAFSFLKNQPMVWNHWGPTEFAEVGSMAMELLAAPHLEVFYSPQDAKRAHIQHLRGIVRFLPYMAIMDAFQHWLYTQPAANISATDLDAKWNELWDRFSPGVDWSGLEDAKQSRWQRQGHLFTSPLYYVEYGLAQLGALQVWKNSLSNPGLALQKYKHALSLGGTKNIPELFAAAGARFVFDTATVGELMQLIETHLEEQ